MDKGTSYCVMDIKEQVANIFYIKTLLLCVYIFVEYN